MSRVCDDESQIGVMASCGLSKAFLVGHIRLFKRLSLVHRSWTKLAQRELRRHVCIDFAEGGGTCSASEMILSADFRKGIERLDISTGV